MLHADGETVSGYVVATGTSVGSPTLDPAPTCVGYSDASGQILTGHVGAGNSRWTDQAAGNCDVSYPLVCVQIDHAGGDIPEIPEIPARFAFVSSSDFVPSSGLAAADALCQAEAEQVGQELDGGIYRALLATTNESALSRFNVGGAPWMRADGLVITGPGFGNGEAQFLAPLSQLANGDVTNAQIWLGNSNLVEAAEIGATCEDWSGNLPAGAMGQTSLAGFAHPNWSDIAEDTTCDTPAPVLCFQDVPVDLNGCLGCLIEGVCLDSDQSPENSCLICKPDISRYVLQPDNSYCTPTGCDAESCQPDGKCATDGLVGDGSACDDGSLCTTGDICLSGFCTGTDKSCDDGKQCTADSCNESDGACVFTPTPTTSCDDGKICTDDDVCDAAGACNGDPGTDCCTLDAECQSGCVTGTCDAGECDYSDLADGTDCSAGDPCKSDVCSDGECLDIPASCDDGLACTVDSCDSTLGCTSTFNSIGCFIAGVCYADGAAKPGNSCMVCDPTTPMVWTPTAVATCDDDDACTMNDTCVANQCQGTLIVCSDDDVCTTDSCDPITGCSFEPDTGPSCDDGNLCTTGDTCLSGTCTGTAKTCGDGNQCTLDSCDESSGNCVNTIVDQQPCNDSIACTDNDKCNSAGECWGTLKDCNDNNSCTNDTCAGGTCANAPVTGSPVCEQDGNLCSTGTCVAGTCQEVFGCDDGNPCTDDTCLADACAFQPNDTLLCDDGDSCTNDVCDAGQCVSTTSGFCELANVAFITSALYTGAEVGDLMGADLKCNTLGQQHFDTNGKYIAWLSINPTDGPEINMNARMADAAGVEAWRRPDGLPIAASYAQLLAGEHWYPLALNELGAPVPFGTQVWTATSAGGNAANDCDDWAGTGSARIGNVGADFAGWTQGVNGNCGTARPLYCLQVDAGKAAVLPPPEPPLGTTRLAFISDETWVPTTGLASAHAQCQQEAMIADLPAGRYKASISSASNSAHSRFDHLGHAWVDAAGTVLTATAADLMDNGTGPQAGIYRDEYGVSLPAQGRFAAGAVSPLAKAGLEGSCANYSPEGSDASIRSVNYGASGDIWWSETNSAAPTCGSAGRRLLCLQDTANLIFTTQLTYSIAELGPGANVADQRCQSAASTAGVAGTFQAWIHTASNTPEARLPNTTGGFVRADGRPVAATAAALMNGELWYSPGLGIDGLPVPNAVSWVGGPSDHCGDWNDNGALALVTVPDIGTSEWQNGSPQPCNEARSLVCVQTDSTYEQPPPEKRTGRVAFVASTTLSGDVTLSAFDSQCQIDAEAQGLAPGVYRALIAEDGKSAAGRFIPGGAIVRPDGQLIAENLAGLDTPLLPIAQFADGTFASGQAHTGAATPNTAGDATSTCANWSSTGGSATQAVVAKSGSGWFAGESGDCLSSARFFCMQDLQQHQTVFVTPLTYTTTELGSAAGADVICQDIADDLFLWGTYMAYLSEDEAAATTRLVAAGAYGGWVNTNSGQIAANANQLRASSLWNLPNLDPEGNLVDGTVWTGTKTDGTIGATTCGDWTVDSGSVKTPYGDTTHGSTGWQNEENNGACSGDHHLYCFQVDGGAQVEAPGYLGRLAFIGTGWNMSTNGGGIASADMHCQTMGEAIKPGTYKAFLATIDASAASRFTDLTTPWVDIDGTLHAATGAAFMSDGTLLAPLARDQDGDYLAKTQRVWTGAATVTAVGTVGSTCDNWSDSAGTVATTHNAHTRANWFSTLGEGLQCGTLNKAIYCLEQ